MLATHIIRAWKDEDYRMSLSQEELRLLPENPVGLIDLSEDDFLGADPGTTITATIEEY